MMKINMNLELKITFHIEKIIFQFILNQLQNNFESLEFSVGRNFFDENKVLDTSIGGLKIN